MFSGVIGASSIARARAAAIMVATALAAVALASPAAAAAAAPSISSISPSSGSVVGGQQVTINGSGFVGAGGACNKGYDIRFGSDAAHGYAISPSSYKVMSDSKLQARVPANFAGPVDVRVYNACGVTPVSAADKFSYQYPPNQCLSGTCQVSIESS